MGHRAEKNRLDHGYITSMSGSGQNAVYTTERPAFVSEKGGKAKGRGYANVPKPHRELPKRAEWAARHVTKTAKR